MRFVLGAPDADVLLVSIVAGAGMELHAVGRDDGGVAIEGLETTDLTRNWGHVRFDAAASTRVADRVTPDLEALRDRVAVLVVADSLGAAQRMLDMTVQYAKEREQFERPVGSFQAVKHLAAEMLVDVETIRSAVYLAAWSVSTGQAAAPAHAAGTKAFAVQAAERVADAALTLHGAIGFTWEHDLQFFSKRAKANVPLFGSPATHLDRVADTLELVPA